MQWGFLGKQQVRPVERQVAVDLVSGYLMEAGSPMLSAGIHENLSAHYICTKKNSRIIYGTVDMAFRSKINYDIRFFAFKDSIYTVTVGNIRFIEIEVWTFRYAL